MFNVSQMLPTVNLRYLYALNIIMDIMGGLQNVHVFRTPEHAY